MSRARNTLGAAVLTTAIAASACSAGSSATTDTTPPATNAASSTSSAVAPTTTTTPPPVTVPNGRLLLAAPQTPQQLAAEIQTTERALRDPNTLAAALPDLGHRQELAYRVLAYAPEQLDAVAALLPADLATIARANVGARRAFFELSSGYADTVPDWSIEAPAPADQLLAWYREAETATGIGWQYLAAINFIETAFGRIHGFSTAGARGPMQFLPSTFNETGIGKGGNIDDPHDAIAAAARYLVRRGGPADMRKALFGYNNSEGYVNGIVAYAELMKADVRAFYAYYNWEIYFSSPVGDLWLPVGYRQPKRISVADYVASAPWSPSGVGVPKR